MSEYDSPEEVKETVEMLVKTLDEIPDELPDVVEDYHTLFVFFIGNQFEGIRPQEIMEQNLLCDEKGEHGMDLYSVDENRFVVYQCKLPEWESIEDKLPKYDVDIINEAEDALTFLTDKAGTAKGNKFAQHARNKYRKMIETCMQDNRTCKLEIILAYFGELTGPANMSLEELKKRWEKPNDECEFEIKTIDYERIASELRLSSMTPARPADLYLQYKPMTEVHTNDWGYMLVPAIHFYTYFNQYKMGLFDLNIRSHLGTTHVNREIERTLCSSKGQKEFHLLNNGITISCTGWKEYSDKSAVKVYHPQIINGCQTVISIYRAYSDMDSESNRRGLAEKCFVPVRIIQTQNPELLDRIVTSSNFQNEMSPRNLRANLSEQRTLQNKFDQLEYKWFYERKDGEFDSLRNYPTQPFKVKHYQYAKNQFRKISNEDLAKSWLSFIGYSSLASEKIMAFELAEDGGNYDWLFLRRPTIEHWNSITKGPATEFEEDYFESSSPTPEQYLLSYLIYGFVKAYLPTHPWNKATCLERLKERKKIIATSSAEEVNKALMDDNEYLRNQILLNMKEVIIELYSWILCKTYGPITGDTAKAILQLEGFHSLFKEPDFKGYASELRVAKPMELSSNILYISMEFIREGVSRWQNMYRKEYQIAPRRIRLLHATQTIEQMKSILEETNEQTSEYGYKWKPVGKRFLETLPKLPI